MSASKLRDKLEKILPPMHCNEAHPGADVYHPGGHPNPLIDQILEAVKSSVPKEMSEDENTRVEMKDKYPNGMIIRYCDPRSYNQAIREVKKLLEGGE